MKLHFVLRSGGGKVLEEDVIDADDLDAHLLLMSVMYNRSIDGGVRWWNPSTGRPIKKPQWTVTEVAE